ncbi:uncharacterized protein PRCAT00006186001 [Priceomyces carsonii]|uniref:uncharacterized protein n=1 Tax=Priceomyces carsonii TaxID=28549 RepID=UPI002ED95BDE|nr:unnamed protein product [Priceomyces carsonii]
MISRQEVIEKKSIIVSEFRSDEESDTQDFVDSNDALQATNIKSELPKKFSLLSSIGHGFNITNSWIGYLSSFAISLTYGGPRLVIFSLIIGVVFQWIIVAGLAEIASTYVTSGGQYHYVYLMAPKKTRRFASFITGWMSSIGWMIELVSAVAVSANGLIGVILFWAPSFELNSWKTYLIYLASMIVSVLPLVLFPKNLPQVTTFTLFFSLLGCVITFIVCLSMQTHNLASFVFNNAGMTEYSSGWNAGPAWLLGSCNAMYAFIGVDSATHIAEEVVVTKSVNPGNIVPLTMNATLIIGFMSVFPLMIALLFGMTDIDAVLSSSCPSLELFYQNTNNKAVATFLQVWLTIVLFCASIGGWVTNSRLTYVLARDNAMPFSKYFQVIDSKMQLPFRAIIFAGVFVTLYGLLYFASTTAFNSIISSSVLGLNISYVIPQGLYLFRGRKFNIARVFDLGPIAGPIINIAALGLIVVIGVFDCFPYSLPVTASGMNYVAPVLIGLFVILILLWFLLGKGFAGPEVDLKKLNALNKNCIESEQLAHEGKGRFLWFFWI